MKVIFPPKLKRGVHVRVVAPAKSFLPTFTEEKKLRAIQRLEDLGLQVSFGKYVYEIDEFESTTIKHRLVDLHDAFADKKVQLILAVHGGATSNQLLKYLDYDLIKNNPKILCGMSDITALANAIYTKTGLVTYSGPGFTIFGAEKQTDYTMSYFEQCLFADEIIGVHASDFFCNKRFDKEEIKSDGFWAMHNGRAVGRAIGGNLITLNLLQGSDFMPNLSGSIVFLEDNAKENIRAVENHLQSLINQKMFHKVSGIIFGRFQSDSNMTKMLLKKIIKTKKELDNIPILANVDFGHTTPMITFPIGGEVELIVKGKGSVIHMIKH
ncbi:MAG: LD-carboxypeptidase [bacterium]|nr:LD-carboxypeptidase [bacterium]